MMNTMKRAIQKNSLSFANEKKCCLRILLEIRNSHSHHPDIQRPLLLKSLNQSESVVHQLMHQRFRPSKIGDMS